MRKFLLIIISILTLNFNVYGQQSDIPSYLLVKKDFSIFKLGDTITNYKSYIKTNLYYKIRNEIYGLDNTSHLPSENSIKIKYIKPKGNKDVIENISVTVNVKYKNNLLKALKTNYDYAQSTDTNTKFLEFKDVKIIIPYTNKPEPTDIFKGAFLDTSLGIEGIPIDEE